MSLIAITHPINNLNRYNVSVIPEKPTLTSGTPSASSVPVGTLVTLICATSSQGSASYTFLVNNHRVAESSGSYTYTASASDNGQTVRFTCTATVNGVVSEPSDVYSILVTGQ